MGMADINIAELSRLTEMPKGNVSRFFKELDEPLISKSNNRITGIRPEGAEKFFRWRGYDRFYQTGVYMVLQQTGGCGKTSTTASLGAACRRIMSRDKAIVFIDCDSQGSLSQQLTGSVANEDEPVLVDWLEKNCTLEELLTSIGDNTFVVKSSLDNIYLDRCLAKPGDISKAMTKFIKGIIDLKGEGTKIFIDTPPQLASVAQSAIIAMAELKVHANILLPVRPDSFALRGARIAVNETKETLSAFRYSPDQLKIEAFLCGYDARVKISVETMRKLIEDPVLKDHVCPNIIRYSSEVAKVAGQNKTVFSASANKQSAVAADYTDLLLYILGFGENR
jgi:cellulose biosynthesis protein BcsQ